MNVTAPVTAASQGDALAGRASPGLPPSVRAMACRPAWIARDGMGLAPIPSMAPPALGIIANPVSARDIRRVVAHAGNLQISERVNILIRVLQAARAAGVQRALMMPDRAGIHALLDRH